MIRIKNVAASGIVVKEMCKMKPLEVGIILYGPSEGNYCMRTASTEHFEVMDLSCPGSNECWDESCELEVEILAPGKILELELFNRE